jgi:hypothetical protein
LLDATHQVIRTAPRGFAAPFDFPAAVTLSGSASAFPGEIGLGNAMK